ncbi:hypothetical protein FRB99_000954 [Tulasnella sp. 403]|nr:hypothetical protein FRB99_000954 [Tulasnella sp. 403]
MGIPRLHAKGRILNHRRGHRNAYPHQSLLSIEGVQNKKDAQFYVGKRVAYVYKGKTPRHGTKLRVIWGNIIRIHGNSGAVRAKFRPNLPAESFGSVFLPVYVQ